MSEAAGAVEGVEVVGLGGGGGEEEEGAGKVGFDEEEGLRLIRRRSCVEEGLIVRRRDMVKIVVESMLVVCEKKEWEGEV